MSDSESVIATTDLLLDIILKHLAEENCTHNAHDMFAEVFNK